MQLTHYQRNNVKIDPASSHLVQLEYDIQVNKNKTLLSCLVYDLAYVEIWAKRYPK